MNESNSNVHSGNFGWEAWPQCSKPVSARLRPNPWLPST